MERKEHSLRIKKLTVGALLTALALILSYIEMMLPLQLAVPGIKLGLANVVIVAALYSGGLSYAFTINLLRICLSGLLFGNVFTIVYSLSGGLLSLTVMFLLRRAKCFSIVGVSMAGGVAHNWGQLLTAALIIQNSKIFFYSPVLLISGTVCGILTGMVSHYLVSHMKNLGLSTP